MYMSQAGGCPREVFRHLSLPSDDDPRIAPGFCYWDNRTRIDLARIAAPARLHQDCDTRTDPNWDGFAGIVALGPASLEQHWNGFARMVAPGSLHWNGSTGTGHARLALGWPCRDSTRINLTRTTWTGLAGMVTLG